MVVELYIWLDGELCKDNTDFMNRERYADGYQRSLGESKSATRGGKRELPLHCHKGRLQCDLDKLLSRE